ARTRPSRPRANVLPLPRGTNRLKTAPDVDLDHLLAPRVLVVRVVEGLCGLVGEVARLAHRLLREPLSLEERLGLPPADGRRGDRAEEDPRLGHDVAVEPGGDRDAQHGEVEGPAAPELPVVRPPALAGREPDLGQDLV